MPNAILTPAATTGTASAWRAGWVMVRRVHLKLKVSIIHTNSLRIACSLGKARKMAAYQDSTTEDVVLSMTRHLCLGKVL